MSFKAFKKIPQLKDAIKGIRLSAWYVGPDEDGNPIYDKSREVPIVKFIGTGKLHGSNAAIRLNTTTNELTPQKRTTDLGGTSGHFGFVEHVNAHEQFYREQLSSICKKYDIDEVIVFGERCGNGIQRKVAISELSKRFVAFEVWDCNNECYLNAKEALSEFRDHERKIFNVWDYKTYEVEMDARYPELAAEQINKFVDEVEQVCPISKAMLLAEHPEKCVDREEYLGEGIVFKSEDGQVWFKSKGDKHSSSDGGGKRATVDPIKAQNVKEFIDKVVTEDRLEQCWREISSDCEGEEVASKQIGDLMRWIFNDIMTEEGDALVHNDLCKKDVSGAIANTARPWFMRKINSFV